MQLLHAPLRQVPIRFMHQGLVALHYEKQLVRAGLGKLRSAGPMRPARESHAHI